MNEVKIPEPFSTIIDNVRDADRRHFETHPDARSYMRPAVPGEFYPLTLRARFVIVRQIRPGARVREPVD